MKKEITALQQKLKKAKNILIALPEHATPDQLCSALTCQYYAQTMDKKTQIVQHEFKKPEKLSFLKDDLNNILPHLPTIQTLNINIDINKAELNDMSYDVIDNYLKIQITTKKGTVHKDHVSIKNSPYRFDTIIAIGAQKKSDIGDPIHNASDFWHATPIINIDIHPLNEHFGSINMVDITHISYSHFVNNIFSKATNRTLDPSQAEIALAGIMSATKGFSHPRMSPQILDAVAELIEAGADREKIHNHLFRNKTINTFKLWGHIFARLELNRENKIAWCTISRDIFLQTQTTAHELPEIAQKIMSESPEIHTVIIFYESQDAQQTTKALLLSSHKETITKTIKNASKLTRDDYIIWSIPSEITVAPQEVLSQLTPKLEKTSA